MLPSLVIFRNTRGDDIKRLMTTIFLQREERVINTSERLAIVSRQQRDTVILINGALTWWQPLFRGYFITK